MFRSRRKVLVVAVILILFIIALRSTIQPIKGTLYGTDLLGFVYRMESNCGFIGGCSHSNKFLGEHTANFNVMPDGEDCDIGKGMHLYNNGYRLDFKQYNKIPDTKFINTEKGLYYNCGIQEVGLDSNTARVINEDCAIDDTDVYCYGRYLPELDASETIILNKYFATTQSEVWYLPGPKSIEKLDPATFIYIGKDKRANYYVKDAYGMYRYSPIDFENPLSSIQGLPSNVRPID